MEENEIIKDNESRIELHTTAKGKIQCAIKIYGKMDTNEQIDELVRKQKYAFAKLRESFNNIIWNEGEKDE